DRITLIFLVGPRIGFELGHALAVAGQLLGAAPDLVRSALQGACAIVVVAHQADQDRAGIDRGVGAAAVGRLARELFVHSGTTLVGQRLLDALERAHQVGLLGLDDQRAQQGVGVLVGIERPAGVQLAL